MTEKEDMEHYEFGYSKAEKLRHAVTKKVGQTTQPRRVAADS